MCWRVCVNNFIFIQVKTGNKCITAGGSGMSCFGNLSSGDGLPLLKNSAGIFVFFFLSDIPNANARGEHAPYPATI